jgi:hypothetical protein
MDNKPLPDSDATAPTDTSQDVPPSLSRSSPKIIRPLPSAPSADDSTPPSTSFSQTPIPEAPLPAVPQPSSPVPAASLLQAEMNSTAAKTPTPQQSPIAQVPAAQQPLVPVINAGTIRILNSSVSSNSLEDEAAKHKKHRLRIALAFLVVIIILGGGAAFYHWYSSQDHSIYSKLKTESYSQNGITFSYLYPTILKSNPTIASKLEDSPVAYSYYVGKNFQSLVSTSVYPVGTLLQSLDLTPAKFISQIRTGSGSYINALNDSKGGPKTFATIFQGCNHTVVTNSGQTAVLCVSNQSDYVTARVIGATASYQYTLTLAMRPALWTAHQKVWQKIENSFSFQ